MYSTIADKSFHTPDLVKEGGRGFLQTFQQWKAKVQAQQTALGLEVYFFDVNLILV